MRSFPGTAYGQVPDADDGKREAFFMEPAHVEQKIPYLHTDAVEDTEGP